MGADLRGADLGGANLHQADLNGALMMGVNLANARCWETIMPWAVVSGSCE